MTEPEQTTLDGMPDGPPPASDEATARDVEPLTARAKEMLLLEQKWFQYIGVKERIVREKFNLTLTRYYQEVNRLLDREAALAWDPITVGRLRRARNQKQRSRATSKRVGATERESSSPGDVGGR